MMNKKSKQKRKRYEKWRGGRRIMLKIAFIFILFVRNYVDIFTYSDQ